MSLQIAVKYLDREKSLKYALSLSLSPSPGRWVFLQAKEVREKEERENVPYADREKQVRVLPTRNPSTGWPSVLDI